MTKQAKIENVEIQALSRRSFLVGTGAASIGVAFGPLARRAFAAAAPYGAGAWVTIAADNTITIVSPASEMGQGSMTSVPILIAEELDADWRHVRFASADDNQPKVYGNPVWGNTLTTYGSGTIRGIIVVVFRGRIVAPQRLCGVSQGGIGHSLFAGDHRCVVE